MSADDTTFLLRSKDRLPTSNSATDFQISLPTPLNIPANSIISLKNINIPYTWYNIVAPNNTWAIDFSGSNYSGTVEPGIYTASSLYLGLGGSITNATGSPFNSFSYGVDNISGLVTFSSDGAGNFTIPLTGSGLGNPLFSYLGVTSTLSGAGTYTFPVMPRLPVIQNLELSIQYLDNFVTNTSGQPRSTTFNILMPDLTTLNVGQTISYQLTTGAQCIRTRGPVTLGMFGVQLRDSDGNVLALNAGDWTAQLGIKTPEAITRK